jgi:hypothetical protein
MERHDMTLKAALDCCPFCDGLAVIHQLDEPSEYVVCCDSCAASSAVVVAIGEDPVLTLAGLWNRRQYRITAAAHDVLVERSRQILDEGFNLSGDDAYQARDLALAASCYALAAGQLKDDQRCQIGAPPAAWPWAKSWWKPTVPRRDLIKAGALILAEIERIDRKNLDDLDGLEPF